jgi:hypothetical protein
MTNILWVSSTHYKRPRLPTPGFPQHTSLTVSLVMHAVYNMVLHTSAPTVPIISFLNVLCYFLALVFPLTARLTQKLTRVSAFKILVQLITIVYATFADAGGRAV